MNIIQILQDPEAHSQVTILGNREGLEHLKEAIELKLLPGVSVTLKANNLVNQEMNIRIALITEKTKG